MTVLDDGRSNNRTVDGVSRLGGKWSFIKDRRYTGFPVERILKTKVANLNSIRWLIGNQSTDVLPPI